MQNQDLSKAYDASLVEDEIYQRWEQSGLFNPDRLPERNQTGEPYCIVMPPPNRTGTLHIGHAVMLAIEDVLIRYHRMKGDKTLWIPGTDHAAIATQVKVEQDLIKKGMADPRKTLGREKFLTEVLAFAETSKTTINKQIRKMGSSCDWSREKYTFDEDRGKAVNTMFRMMFEDGIIERGFRVVNWDPQFKTTLSDDEVETKETTANLVTFTYDKEFPIPIATTRPETKFGDTAIAVHPDDKRYKKLVGKTYEPRFCGKKLTIQIVADDAVDPTFGTGAVGVTPAHSMTDADIADRHGLTMEQVIDQDGKMMSCGSAFDGLTTIEARNNVIAELRKQGLIQKEEEVPQSLPIAQRGGAVVEQLPMRQWFVRVNKKFTLRQATLKKWKKGDEATLKELMTEAVRSKLVRIIPDRFEKIYFHWIDHLRDWCISRQIWFGHQIPVWYRSNEMVASAVTPGPDWVRDPDTLDTWFSSGMWTFSTLGWPAKTSDLKIYHPTAVLETGYDILFFWVARMILMSAYALGEIPFHEVYLHGLVRDEQGRKMSKSLGNVLDPLDLISKYGTDAVRLSLLIGTTPGQDARLSEEKIAGFRNFTNKLWNISRYILGVIASESAGTSSQASRNEVMTLADQWICSRMSEVIASVSKKIEKYDLSSAGEELRDFTWGDLADWYLEIAKVEKGKPVILRKLLSDLLKLWHPFMPFVTEYVWSIAGFDGSLMVSEWPTISKNKSQHPDVKIFERLRALVTDVRRLRAEQKVVPSQKLAFEIAHATAGDQKIITMNTNWIQRLTNGSAITFVKNIRSEWASVSSGAWMAAFNPSEGIDASLERDRIEKELEATRNYLASMEQKLADEEFRKKAPASVVHIMDEKRKDAQIKASSLEKRLKSL